MPGIMKTRLTVNSQPIDLNEFAHEYITRVLISAVSMLKGGEHVQTLHYSLSGDRIELVINDQTIPLTPFPKAAVAGTITGMVSSLRGVDKIENLHIEMKPAD